jgi:tetratricopeptide (TPR) repeat protein
MFVRRTGLLAAPIVLVIGLGTHQPVRAQPAELRTVTMRAAPDEAYRAQPSWEASLRTSVAAVSAIYEKTFQIRFVILDIVPWTAGPTTGAERLIGKLMADVPVGQADLVVGFSNRCERLKYGWTLLFGRYAMVTTGCYETAIFKDLAPPDVVLSHELAHVFGAFHPAITVDSVMRGGPPDKFDEQTIRVIRLTRNFDFSRGVMGVDEETRRAWGAIYAEGHARDEPNPLAAAITNAGWTMLRSGKIAEGEAALHDAIKLDPSFAAPHGILGFLYSRTGRLEDAARELGTAKALDFHQVEARTELGFVLLRLRKYEEALWEFREVVRVEPRLGRAYIGLGRALVRSDKVDEAINAYAEAIRLDPKDASTFDERGSAFRRKGAYTQAIQDYDQAILLRPVDAVHWNNRCFTRAIVGRLEEALADCNESLRLRPDSPPALDSRGLTYLKLGQPDRAIADYDAALRLLPTSAHSLYGRGLAKRKKGDVAGADADIAAASAISRRIADDYTAYGVRP